MSSEDRSTPYRGKGREWIPAIVGGRYRVERELGSGAAAVTVAAIDETLGRRVAVKLLKPESELDPEFSRRFSREARAAASVNHQNVVNVYDVGQGDDLLYLVMQYVDGSDLKQLVEREGALPWRRAVDIARAVLSGLAAIHATGIVHRDIKPQNVLIGRDGSVKVTDFGVVHVERDSGLTTAGMTVGTAAYMAPEQAQGNTPTPAADLYAVGVMLYEMVSGGVPFSAPTPVAVMLAHIQREASPPTTPRGMERLPDGLVAVIRQAMSKDPESRFRGADAMRRALENPESWQRAADATPMAGRTVRTQAIPVTPARRSAEAPRRHAQAPPVEERSGGGFGTLLVTMLIVLAFGLVATAGVLWYLENTGDDPEDPGAPPTDVVRQVVDAPTRQVIPDESEEDNDEPGVILPVETEVPAPAPTDAPEPAETVIVPPIETSEPEPTSTTPSTEPNEEVIIEPMDESPTLLPDG